MNLFVIVAFIVTGGFGVASIGTQRVVQTLQSELAVAKRNADEKKFAIKVLAAGVESRLDFVIDALQEKRDRGERPGN